MDMLPLMFPMAWVWFVAGVLSGLVQGLFFHREDWLGGYGSWRRRLMRLGHIAFFGTGALLLAFALTHAAQPLPPELARWSAALLLIGAITMPLVCFLAAWRKPLRHLFAVPVLTLVGGVALTAIAVFAASTPALVGGG